MTSIMRRHPSQTNRFPGGLEQRGIVLITGLIFLAILTVLGVTAMQSTNLQERMSGNLQKRTVAFQRAEEGIETARQFVADEMAGVTSLTSAGPLYAFDTAPAFDDPTAWNNAVTNPPGGLTLPPNTSYYIERGEANPVEDPGTGCPQGQSGCLVNVFEVTVRAFDGPAGGQGNAEVILRSRIATQ